MLAQELRKISEDCQNKSNNARALILKKLLEDKARTYAIEGKFSYRYWIGSSDWSVSDLHNVKPLLEQEGFKVIVDLEITSMYSNTDWDSDDFIQIEW